MDVIELRRGLLLMATVIENDSKLITGSITVKNGQGTINIGKNLKNYIVFIEMDSTGKQELINMSTYSGPIAFAWFCIHPKPNLNGASSNTNTYYIRYNPQKVSIAVSTTSTVTTQEDSITFPVYNITSSGSGLYIGYTYNYYILELD